MIDSKHNKNDNTVRCIPNGFGQNIKRQRERERERTTKPMMCPQFWQTQSYNNNNRLAIHSIAVRACHCHRQHHRHLLLLASRIVCLTRLHASDSLVSRTVSISSLATYNRAGINKLSGWSINMIRWAYRRPSSFVRIDSSDNPTKSDTKVPMGSSTNRRSSISTA